MDNKTEEKANFTIANDFDGIEMVHADYKGQEFSKHVYRFSVYLLLTISYSLNN